MPGGLRKTRRSTKRGGAPSGRMSFILMALSDTAATLMTNRKHADVSNRLYSSIDDALKSIPTLVQIHGNGEGKLHNGADIESLKDPKMLRMYEVAKYVQEGFGGQQLSFHIIRVA